MTALFSFPPLTRGEKRLRFEVQWRIFERFINSLRRRFREFAHPTGGRQHLLAERRIAAFRFHTQQRSILSQVYAQRTYFTLVRIPVIEMSFNRGLHLRNIAGNLRLRRTALPRFTSFSR